MTSARFLPNCYKSRQSAARADTSQGWQRNRLRPSCGRTAARPDIVFRVFQELRFLLRVEPRQTVQQHLQNFQLVVQKARRIVTVNAVAGEKAVNRAVQTLFSVVQEEAEAQQLRENDRLCFSVLSNYARVLRRWKVQYAAKAPDKRFVEACHKLDEAEYYLDILCAGDSHERAEVVSYLLVDGRLDKLKETINGRDAA